MWMLLKDDWWLGTELLRSYEQLSRKPKHALRRCTTRIIEKGNVKRGSEFIWGSSHIDKFRFQWGRILSCLLSTFAHSGFRKKMELSYILELPKDSKIYPVFHVSLLKKKIGDNVVAHEELPTVEIKAFRFPFATKKDRAVCPKWSCRPTVSRSSVDASLSTRQVASSDSTSTNNSPITCNIDLKPSSPILAVKASGWSVTKSSTPCQSFFSMIRYNGQ